MLVSQVKPVNRNERSRLGWLSVRSSSTMRNGQQLMSQEFGVCIDAEDTILGLEELANENKHMKTLLDKRNSCVRQMAGTGCNGKLKVPALLVTQWL